MATRRAGAKQHVHYHRDGSIWATGKLVDGVATGYWEWFRKDGTRMRSGHFEAGQPVGQWTTYDRQGRVVRVTTRKPGPAASSKPTGSVIDNYLAGLPADQRAALEKLRKAIRAAAPRAEECLSYQLPAFRLDGRVLAYFGASARHCAFYPGSGTAVAAHRDALAGYTTSKGAIRFQPDRPLPATLVRRLVKYRIAES